MKVKGELLTQGRELLTVKVTSPSIVPGGENVAALKPLPVRVTMPRDQVKDSVTSAVVMSLKTPVTVKLSGGEAHEVVPPLPTVEVTPPIKSRG